MMGKFTNGGAGSARMLLAHVAFLAVLPFVAPSVPLATEIAIMTLATLSCHLLLVYGPLLSFGQGAFFGVGAYAGGLAALHVAGRPGVDIVVVLLVSGLITAVLAAAVGFVALRRIAGLGGHGAGGVTFLMLTFAVAQIAYFAAYNLPGLTGGENGLLDVSRLRLGPTEALSFSLESPMAFYALCATVLVLAVAFVDILSRSTIGQAFKAIRSNEHRASAIGYNVFALRLALFVFAGALAGMAGVLYAMFVGLVPLSVIELLQSERIVIMAILGGTGSLAGALLGTTFFILGADLLSQIWPHWPFALGAMIVFVVFFAREGLAGLLNAATQKAVSVLRPVKEGGGS